MREAVLTVSPKRQYRGIFSPTTPATTGPSTVAHSILFHTIKLPNVTLGRDMATSTGTGHCQRRRREPRAGAKL